MKKEISQLIIKYKAFLLPFVVGVSSLILIVFVIYPQLTGFFKGQEDLQIAEQKLKKLQVKASDLENLDEDDLKKKLNFALVALPLEKDYATIIGVFQRLTAESGMSLENLQVGGGGAGADKKTSGYSIKLELLGTKPGLDQLLGKIGQAPQVMKVSGIEVTSFKTDVNVALTIDVFYLPAPTSLGALDSDLPKITDEEQKLLARLASISPASVPTTTPATLLPRGKPDPFQ